MQDFIYFLQQPYAVWILIIPILEAKKLRHRVIKSISTGHRVLTVRTGVYTQVVWPQDQAQDSALDRLLVQHGILWFCGVEKTSKGSSNWPAECREGSLYDSWAGKEEQQILCPLPFGIFPTLSQQPSKQRAYMVPILQWNVFLLSFFLPDNGHPTSPFW